MSRLSHADARLLHLVLADAESGSPRQWWHLEIAASLLDLQSGRAIASAWVRGLARLVRLIGADRSAAMLSWIGLVGMAPYRMRIVVSLERQSLIAMDCALSVLAFLVGLGAIVPSRQFVLVMVGLLGSCVSAVVAARSTARARRTLLAQQAAVSESLAPSESTLGLAGLLASVGCDFSSATRQARNIALAPDAVPEHLLALLGLRQPAYSAVIRAAFSSAAIFSLTVAVVAWPCWLLDAAWQLPGAVVGAVAACFVATGHRTSWYRRPAVSSAISAAALLLGWSLAGR